MVCGGTTCGIVADRLGKRVTTSLDYSDPEIPPIGHIDGVDLVTEGVITLSRVVEYARAYTDADDVTADGWKYKRDGASLVAQMLFETATDINFFVGKAINPAHQNPNLPGFVAIKIQLVDELAKCLEKMGKRVKVSYF